MYTQKIMSKGLEISFLSCKPLIMQILIRTAIVRTKTVNISKYINEISK